MILVGCEESGTLTTAFRDAGYEAYSCDMEPTRGNHLWHVQGDIMKEIGACGPIWDLVILHPPCTALCLSGNGTYGVGKPKHKERLEAIKWTLELFRQAIHWSKRVALENPTGVLFPEMRKRYPSNQISWVQPWEHGHGETKKTGFFLHRLPKLKPTKVVEGREQKVWKMSPSPNRSRDRSKTYQGIADAIVQQWGALI